MTEVVIYSERLSSLALLFEEKTRKTFHTYIFQRSFLFRKFFKTRRKIYHIMYAIVFIESTFIWPLLINFSVTHKSLNL